MYYTNLTVSTYFFAMGIRAKVFTVAKKFVGEPKLTDFQLKEEEIDTLNDGEFIAAAMFFGINAGLRAYQELYSLGSIVFGGQVARIIESKNSNFAVGKIIYGQFGWRSHTLVKPDGFSKMNLYILPDFGDLPYSLGVGYLGMTGNTAYFGLNEICQPIENETVVVTAAAGSVGSLVGQIAKIKSCTVIGFAGSDEKCNWLENDLGFDKAINYKKGDMAMLLKEAAPKGVDCFFDNVGGELSSIVISQMNQEGRIAVCGAVSEYNCEEQVKIPSPLKTIILKQLTLKGFVVYRYSNRWMEGIEQNLKWLQEGKIKFRETITEGFENLPQAFIDVLRGKNMGRAILKV